MRACTLRDGQERLNWHIEKMELMLRLLDNDNLSYEDIKSIQVGAVAAGRRLRLGCGCVSNGPAVSADAQTD